MLSNSPRTIILYLLVIFPGCLTSQGSGNVPGSDTASEMVTLPSDPSACYDFWLGTWEAAWDEGDGIKAHGTNTITRQLDGKVLTEQFRVHDGSSKGFKGTSISVYTPAQETWHQAWADNQGGYFDLVGSTDGDKRIFGTPPREVKGQTVIQRMVFHDITRDSFIWDWERTTDGGETWNTLWQIYYRRTQP